MEAVIDSIQKIIDAISGIASGGVIGNGLKLILVIFLMYASFAYRRKLEEKAKEDSKKESDRVNAEVPDENTQIGDELRQAESDIDDLMN